MPARQMDISMLKGLPAKEIPFLRQQYGRNIFRFDPSRRLLHIIRDIFFEPMFLLLAVACSLYFILGKIDEGVMMVVAMVLVAAISIYQEVKSSRAMDALKQYTEPRVTVIRDGEEQIVATEDLVPGDIMILDEGQRVPADAVIERSNDLSVNESIITGESLPVEKTLTQGLNELYQGTTINSGKCYARVKATGNQTVLGKLGKAVSAYSAPKTLLQQQIGRFVKRMALFGLAAFIIIWLVNYYHERNIIQSLLFALTLAMAVIPEEIPVAFSSFMALGAYKMSKLGIISRQPQVVENLGAVSVICLDKTGTITENKMQVKMIYDHESDELTDIEITHHLDHDNVLYYAVLASEKEPFDAMEKAIWETYDRFNANRLAVKMEMTHEYPLAGQPPMMTHVYQFSDVEVAASKGAVERIIDICDLGDDTKQKVGKLAASLAKRGYRVIGVASAIHLDEEFPELQDHFNWKFEGMLALYDPPKKDTAAVIKKFYDAGIDVKLLTGDHPGTAVTIAGQVGIDQPLKYFTGHEVMNMSDTELRDVAGTTSVFARMFPDAKLKVIEALKANREIVAMTGDGVNDGPALKSSNIGIAMGYSGTEIARQASDLILTNDDLGSMVTAIREGRKIFSNLKKAVRYIISIHVPIILTASLPLLLGWKYPNIFTPIHIIFLELIMGPTCSIFFENEPVEESIMNHPPRDRASGLFTWDELLISITQGIIITTGVLVLYYFFMKGHSLESTRTIVFTTLISANVFLTFANRSFDRTLYHTGRYRNYLVPVMLAASVVFMLCLHFVPFVRDLFGMTTISIPEFCLCLAVAFASVMWFEVYKMGIFKN